jgi:NAD(P)-dependent dehydrogenase (short-subunit alcohol dehydrogenase family)
MDQNRALEGRVAVVTGGAVGIGAEYVKALARAGASVVIADIAAADEVCAAVQAREGASEVIAVHTDVSDEASVAAMVSTARERFGRIDVLVNNAALFSALPPTSCVDIDVETWDRVQAINVRGSFLTVKHIAPLMIEQKQGKIINIGSGVAYKGMPEMLHYATSKGSVISMTRSLARELGQHGICVNTLSPGLVLSSSILANDEHLQAYQDPVVRSRSIKRDGYPEDLLGALIFLASSASDFYTGQNLVVDGGSVNT